jgi:hypothetical protein
VKYLIGELRAIVAQGGDCDAILLAYRLGRLTERLQVLPFEPFAKSGRKSSSAGRKGAIILNNETAEIYRATHPKIKARVDELMAQGDSFTRATEATALEQNMSGRYVREVYGPNPAPRNRGRKR